ncbi:MAG TPA: hypothetical protein PKY29_02050 [Ferruginibacter sp.]|nr:hypothetical protein [Ferruginibacter sp.]HRO17100.1 hypothetical protein [Ferruginibacter sp.]HRQ20063.1 hypothetical protein [Ferruginibacter sp.]
MKQYVRQLLSIALALISISIFLSCNKNCECDSTNRSTLKNLQFNGESIALRTGLDGIKFTLATNEDIDVNTSIIDLLDSLNVNPSEYNFPVGAAFYLEDTLLTNGNIIGAKPFAFLMYDLIDGRIITKYFKQESSEFIYDPNYTGITSLFSYTDIVDIMNLNFITPNEILAICDLSILNKSIYISDFQNC